MYRTMLFTPADHPRRREKALTLPADAVILDLEDAVAVQEKERARQEARAFIEARAGGDGVPPLYVRVNDLNTPWAFQDLLQVTVPGLAGIVLPKTESAFHVRLADWILANRERELGLEEGHFHLIPIIETSEGVANAYAIATASPRLKVLAFGSGDYTKDIDVKWPQDGTELLYPRMVIVNASRRAGLAKPLDGPWPRIEDLEGLERDCLQAAGLGFGGKIIIYPTQIEVAHRVFSPSSEDVARARAIVDAFAQAEREGKASIRVNGEFVDYPIVERAKRVLAAYERIQQREGRVRP